MYYSSKELYYGVYYDAGYLFLNALTSPSTPFAVLRDLTEPHALR